MPVYRKRNESTLITEILKYCQLLENQGQILFYSRIQAGNIFIPQGRGRVVRMGRAGIADIMVIPKRKTLYGATMVWIEAKHGDGKQTAEQKKFQEIIGTLGQSYELVRNMDEVEKIFT